MKKVVIVGAGFAGLAAAKGLARADAEITVIDARNYHLFQPLLYQVATAGLSPADIAWPIRRLLRRQDNVRVILGRVTGIDREKRAVLIGDEEVPYDSLVLATGARHAYFGKDLWEPFAPGLKTIEDATGIRRRILMAFEQAELESDPVRQARLLTFVIVGGGPTGVELAGAIAELSRKALAADFHHIDPRKARVVLVEAGPGVLSSFPERLSSYAVKALEKLGVEVELGAPITECGADGVRLGERRIETETILWAAGVAASPAGLWLGAEQDKAGRVAVTGRLEVPDDPGIFVIGDTAAVASPAGGNLPGIAPVAKQEGAYVAKVIRARLAQQADPPPFRYLDMGQLATIGRRAAVADFKFLRLSGYLAWWIWSLVHVYFLIGNRNRLQVSIHWLWSYLTFDRGTRLITGADEQQNPPLTD